MKKFLVVLLTVASSISFSTQAAVCNMEENPERCIAIQKDIDLQFKPSPKNNFGRYRSFMAMEANKRRLSDPEIPKYSDYSSEAYGEGQLWLSLPENKRDEAFEVDPANIRSWLIDNASADRYADLKSEIKKFSSLSDQNKIHWMLMAPAKRITASYIDNDEWLNAFILGNSSDISYQVTNVESVDQLFSHWKLF